ncbi:MAG: hypothetical protein ACOYLB_13050 [Phototrophicaceae bacterium]
MSLSRRQFLYMVGILASQQGGFLPAHARTETRFGRVLSGVSTPMSLSANRPVEILGERGENFITHLGTIPKIALQPMPHYSCDGCHLSVAYGDSVEVISTHAPIYQYASYHSPFHSTLGHGALLHVTDQLTDEEGSWIQVATVDHQSIGWSPVEHWGKWEGMPTLNRLGEGTWVLDTTTHQLIVRDGTHTLATLPINHPRDLQAGDFPFTPSPNGGYRLADRVGVPCLGTLDTPLSRLILHGVYWHHDFGREHALPTLEVSIEASHWLRESLCHPCTLHVM